MNFNELYRAVIMDHYKDPQNKGLLSDDRYKKVSLYNASCGDEITIQALIEEGRIVDLRQDGHGCSICCSSASVMTQELKGLKVEDATHKINEFLKMLTGEKPNSDILKGEPLAYQGVAKFPARVRCASISWKAMETIIKEESDE